MHNGFAHTPFSCCGGCKFAIPEVEVLYWSTTSSAECSQGNATVSYPVNLVTKSNDKLKTTVASRPQAPSPVIIGGYTLEFPSLYLAIHGAVSVTDSCGVRGRTYDNPTIAVPPGSLSTISWHNSILGYDGYAPQTGVYDPAACHTYGVDDGSTTSWLNELVSSWETSVSYNIGPPYNPILLPPAQLTALDPDWEACTAWDDYGENAYDLLYGLYDPPRVLNTAPALIEPSTTSPDPTARQTHPVVQPAGSILSVDPASIPVPAGVLTLDQPKATSNAAPAPPKEGADPGPQQNDPTALENSLPQAQPNAGKPNSDPNGNNDPQEGSPPKQASDPKQDNDPSQDSSSNIDSGQGTGAKPNGDTKQGDSNQGSYQIPDSMPQNHPKQIDTSPFDDSTKGQAQESPKDADPNLSVHQDPAAQGNGPPPMTIRLRPGTNEQPTTIFLGGNNAGTESTSGLGALIYNAFGKVDPTVKTNDASDPKASPADPIASFPTITAAGQLLTISNPSAVSIAGTLLTPGGAAATVAGTPVSLASSGNLVVGTAPSYQGSTVLTIAGHTVTANPTSFQIAGTPIKAGERAVTISGTPIRIGSSGDLIIGGSASTTPPPAAVYTVGAQKFTADGGNLVRSDTTVRAGGPAVLVAGTTVSLGPSGVLVVGDTTSTLAGLSHPSTFTVGSDTFTANPTRFTVAGATLSAGGPGITVDSTPISLNPSGSLIIGMSTIPLQNPTPAVMSTDGVVFTVGQNGAVNVDGATLRSGGPGTVISGTAISVGAGGVVVGSDTVRLPSGNGSASSTMALFTGAASRSIEGSRLVLWGLLGVMMVF